MGGFADFQKAINNTIKQLNDERRKNTQILALDAFDQVANRVINTGQTATGGTFEAYSPGYEKAKREGTAQRGVGPRTTAFRDFKLTNNMWKATGPIFESESASKTSFIHGSSDPVQQAKIDINTQRSGDFLALSASEIVTLHETNQERLNKTLKDNGIG